MPLTYKDAGVDIEAGNALVDRIRPLAAETRRPGTVSEIGGFAGLFDLRKAGYSDPILVSTTDGVGTKLRVAIESNDVSGIGVDLVAMCVNDLICHGAVPLFFLDYLAMGKIEPELAADIVKGIAKACRTAGCALIGGETAEMPGLYRDGDFDLAGFALGAAERHQLLPRDIRDGDVLLGLPSSGLHSNGFSLVRKVVADSGLSWFDAPPFQVSSSPGREIRLCEEVLEPTRIYVDAAGAAISTGKLKALAHITGGGLTENVMRVLPAGLGVKIDLDSWNCPEIFKWIEQRSELGSSEMLRVFNCGIGMVAMTSAETHLDVLDAVKDAGNAAIPLGRVCSGDGAEYAGSLF